MDTKMAGKGPQESPRMGEPRQQMKKKEKTRKMVLRPKVLGRFSGPKKPENRAPVEARARFSCFCFFSENELKKKAGAVGSGAARRNAQVDGEDLGGV